MILISPSYLGLVGPDEYKLKLLLDQKVVSYSLFWGFLMASHGDNGHILLYNTMKSTLLDKV